MVALEEKQFELGGYVFGLDRPIEVDAAGWNPGSATIRSDPKDLPSGDGIRFGRGYRGSATWGFSLYTNLESEDEAWAAVDALNNIWDADEVRSNPGSVMPLRYCVAGKTRIVYGQPGRFTAVPTNTSMSGLIKIEADFSTVDHLVYDEEYKYVTVPVGMPADPNAGFTVPFIAPFTSVQSGLPRQRQITVGGTKPTPAIVTFNGPLSLGRIEVAGWTAELRDPVYEDDPVTIDARPWARSATRQSGGAVRVNPQVTRIYQMMLPPGTHQVILTGTDPSGAASVTVGWHDAYSSVR